MPWHIIYPYNEISDLGGPPEVKNCNFDFYCVSSVDKAVILCLDGTSAWLTTR